jgi:two-component system sensor histidine kinase KdpD
MSRTVWIDTVAEVERSDVTRRGTLRVYVGAAPGVGKTYRALQEIHDLVSQGVDAVVGYVEPHGRQETEALIEGLETVPRREVHHQGTSFAEMDTKAILDREPAVVLVDELAHTNVPGSGHLTRWQDIEDILEASIDVISTVNIQHFESLNDVVEDITGVSQNEIIPDDVVRRADEIHLVDLTQQAVRERLAAGKIYPVERVDAALSNFFRPGNLGALRELALSWTADRVDEAVDEYRRSHGIDSQWETRERVVVGITGTAGGEDTIRRAARMAMRSKGELLGVYVRPADGLTGASTPALNGHRELLERLGGAYHEVAHADIGESLVAFARAHNATQLVVGTSRRNRWQELFIGSVIQRVLRLAGDIDVHVISNPVETPTRVRMRPSPLPRRRRVWGWLAGAIGFLVATFIMLGQRGDVALQNVLLVYLSIAAAVAWIGGIWPALTAAVAGFLLGNYLFTPPYRTWTIANPADVFALAAFLFLAGLIGFLVGLAARRSSEAATAKAEAETLGGLIGAGGEGSVSKLIERLQVALDAKGIALFLPGLDTPMTIASAGENPPRTPEEADRTKAVGEAVIGIVGDALDAVDERLLAATATELGTVLDRAALAEHAAEVDALGRANELRIALLRAVSHDLRSPLSAIQASVTSMLQDDVEWPAEEEREFLQTISEETERLNRVVSDLLDAGRLQTGMVQVKKQQAGIEDVISTVATAFRYQRDRLSFDAEVALPDVSTDPALLERIVENLVRNALDHAPPDTPVRVTAGVVGDRVDLRVIDRGPGIDPESRLHIFEPFRTIDDSHMAGVGLGLAVAKGLADALGHGITVDDTPGGGTTMVLSVELYR